MIRRTRSILVLLLLVGLALRLGWALSRPVDDAALAALPDQLEYLQAGRNLLHGGGFWFIDPRFDQRIYAGRTIGYPLLIAACGGNVRAIQIAQCGLDVSTALAVYLLAKRWLSDRRSLFACLLVVVNPVLVHFCALALTETLYITMLTWSVVLLLRRRTAVWGIALCALSVHVRPSGLPMPAVLGGLAALTWVPKPTWRIATAIAAAGACMTVIALLPWGIRNHGLLGRFVFLATNSGITLYDGVHPAATGASDQSFVKSMPQLATLSEIQRDDYFSAEAWRCIRSDPGRILALAARKAARTWSPVPLSEQYGSRLYILVGLLYALPLFVLAAIGVLSGGLPSRVRLLLIAPALVLTLMQMLTVGSLRYRLPAEPMLCVLAASARMRKPTIDTSHTQPCVP